MLLLLSSGHLILHYIMLLNIVLICSLYNMWFHYLSHYGQASVNDKGSCFELYKCFDNMRRDLYYVFV